MRIFLYAARYDGQSIYPDIEYGMPKSAQRSNTDPYRSDPDAKRLQGREQLKALAHAARRDRAARSEEEQLLVARRRMARLRECVPTFWKTGGTVLLFLYPLVAASIFIFWTLHQKELAWTVLAGLAPGVPVLFFLRVWRIRHTRKKNRTGTPGASPASTVQASSFWCSVQKMKIDAATRGYKNSKTVPPVFQNVGTHSRSRAMRRRATRSCSSSLRAARSRRAA